MNFNILKMVYLPQLGSEQPRDLYFCEYLIMHFLQGFSEIFLQQWSGHFCQTVFGAVVCK